MNLLELWRSKECLFVAVENFELIRQLELLEEPENTLRARLFEPSSIS
jgi:hypothetical protein